MIISLPGESDNRVGTDSSRPNVSSSSHVDGRDESVPTRLSDLNVKIHEQLIGLSGGFRQSNVQHHAIYVGPRFIDWPEIDKSWPYVVQQ